MEHIVNPWFIYLLSVVNNFGVLLTTGAVLSGTGYLVYIIIYVIYGLLKAEDCGGNNDFDNFLKNWSGKGKASIYLFLLFIILAVVCPNKNTIIAMYVADKVTYDTAGEALKSGKAFKDELKKDVIDIIESITKQKEKK
ncbi:hypothetical protein LCGC14_0351600 [marine sediment metagenome]|uniref:Uncharacterized protein n=1 Tax=marine sediment metagenome TaxID=412755 RepID=A0A0F9VY05_9ZZZZ